MIHECMERFDSKSINNDTVKAYNRCYGVFPMIFEVWLEYRMNEEDENWMRVKVDYCPFCGLRSQPV